MSDRETIMSKAVVAVVKAAGGEVRVSREDFDADHGAVGVFHEGEEILIKRFDSCDDALGAVLAAQKRIEAERS